MQEQLQIQQTAPDARIETLTAIIAAERAAMVALRRACPWVKQDSTELRVAALVQELKGLCEQVGENWHFRCAMVERRLEGFDRVLKKGAG